jgi:hypothetical protein
MAGPESYFERRAEAELELAQQAVHPSAVRAHYLLAGYYLDQVYGGGQSDATAQLPVENILSGDAPKR